MMSVTETSKNMYRISEYNYCLDYNTEIKIIFNTFSGAIVSMSSTEYSRFMDLSLCTDSELETFHSVGLIIPKSNDTKRVIDFNRAAGVFSNKKHTYAILTTTECNARCFYCYEKGTPHYNMNIDVADKVSNFISSKSAEKSKIDVQWFGGEPLLNPTVIDRIVCNLQQLSITPSYSMITNGLLFDEKMLQHSLKNNWAIERVQITLDGDKKEYENRKQYVNVSNAFERVIENISGLLKQSINVSVRLNYDVNNVDSIIRVIDTLGERFSAYKNFKCYVYPLFDIHEKTELEQLEANKTLLKLWNILKNKNLYKVNLPLYRQTNCYACNANSFVIHPSGDLFKCSMDLENKVGNVDSVIDKNNILLDWCDINLSDKCHECIFLPLCQGGCTAGKLGIAHINCFLEKNVIDDLLKMYYEEKILNKAI